jgi:protein-S-isoprenylcysteine O-methyltransferase Ste14
MVFDPIRWPGREFVSRMTALSLVSLFLWLRLDQFHLFPQSFKNASDFYAAFKTLSGTPVYSLLDIKLLWGVKLAMWLIETAIYLGYIVVYTSRAKVISVAKGFMETAFPVSVAGIPVLMALMPYSLPRWAPFSSPSHLYFYLGIATLIVWGGIMNLVGLLALRRSFTIMSEARELVVQGIFSYIRHPIYTAHFIMFLGSLLLRLHLVTVAMYTLFCVGQILRARIEEQKLTQVFPLYADYQGRTGMFFPKMFGIRSVNRKA